MNSKSLFLVLLKRLIAPTVKARRSAAKCRHLPFQAGESLKVRQAHPAAAALRAAAPAAASKLKSLPTSLFQREEKSSSFLTKRDAGVLSQTISDDQQVAEKKIFSGCSKMPRCKAPEILRSEAYLEVRRNNEG
jgi:hypothetical protein